MNAIANLVRIGLSTMLLLWAMSQPLWAQPLAALQHKMEVGAYYYPEHWPSAQWERDLARMSDLGFTFTHFAEFAWSQLEPEEGEYDFAWLDNCIALAAKYKLKVIMCTPSPTPPAWLTEKHPEILVVDDKGQARMHGGRLHAAYNHPVYRHYVEKIVKELGKRYGQDTRIWGWQLDNEPHYASIYDYSPWQEKQFRYWLRQQYGTIDSLNYAWGTSFWSQVYNHFDQIHLPNPNGGVNPHAMVDFKRFSSEQVAEGLRFQEESLRKLINPSQWITTNFAYYKFLPSVNPFLSRGSLDFASHTMYLTSQYLGDAGDALAHRLGSGLQLSFSQEVAQSVTGVTGIMELQPGQINWGAFNPQPLPGAVRMWVWHVFGLGDRFACTYRFRQPLFGGEQTHHGIMMTDGVTVQRGGEEYVQAMKELADLPAIKDAQTPKSLKQRRTAFLWDQRNLWDLEQHPHHQDWDTWSFWYTYYGALKRMGVPVDFVTTSDELDPETHPFLVVPAGIRVDAEQIKQWEAYAQAGGNLILSCRTATKDANGHMWEAKLQEPIWDLIGAEISYFDHLPTGYPGKVEFENTSHTWHVWGDILEPKGNTKVWSTYQDQFYAGKAAATHRKLGKGSVTYLGAWTDDRNWEYQLLRSLYEQEGTKPFNLPAYVFVEWRAGYWVAVNYTADEVQLPVEEGVSFYLGGQQLPAGGVSVWKD